MTQSRFQTPEDIRDHYNQVVHFRSPSLNDEAAPTDAPEKLSDTVDMNDVTRDELRATLSAIEERMDRRAKRMEKVADRRSEEFLREIALRDDAIRRELELRRESSIIEQAERDKALAARDQAFEEKIGGFLSTQTERDRLYTEKADSVFRRLDDRDQVIDSKLALMENSLLQVKSTVDGFQGSLTTSAKDFETKLGDGISAFKSELTRTLNGVKSSNRNTGIAILTMAAATVLGIWGANSTIVGSAVGIFDGGRNSAERTMQVESLLRDSKAQSEATYALLKQMQEQQLSPQKSNSQKPNSPAPKNTK